MNTPQLRRLPLRELIRFFSGNDRSGKMQRASGTTLNKIVPTSTVTITHRHLRTVDFRPLLRLEGQRMTAGDDAEDTAIASALKRAAGEKLRKEQQRREEKEARKQARLDRIKSKTPDAQDRPEPVAAPASDAALQVSAQHFLQDKAAREERIRALTSIALGRSTAPVPAPIERLPPPPPSGPDDPRIQNGTLAPSPKVAAMLKRSVSEAATVAAKPERAERTGHPEAWAEVLRTGTPNQILATRRFKDLKGTDLEAFNLARKREFNAILAGRKLSELPPSDREAYFALKVQHMALMTDRSAPRARRKGSVRCRVGQVIDKLRHEAGLTQEQVAEHAGIPAYRLPLIVAGKKVATNEEATRLGNLFNVKPEIFMPTTPLGSKAEMPSRPATLNGVSRPKANSQRPGYSEEYDRRRLEEVTEPRDTDTYFQAALRRIMRERGIMGEPLAKLCGLSRDVPARLLRVGSVPHRTTREKLTAGLGVTAEELFGPEALQGTPEAPQAAPAPEAVAEPSVDQVAVLVAPTVSVEMDVPMPDIVLRADRYPWDMPKGGSFKAEAPFGMPWATFRSRFLSMIDRQSEKLGHWYTYEENEREGLIRVWRYI